MVPLYFLHPATVSSLGWDFHAYYAAATAALAGEPFVGIDTGLAGVTFVYPPPAVLLFVPQAALGSWQLAFLAHSAVNAAAALGVAALAVRTVESRRGRLRRLDRLLVVGFCVGSAPAVAALGLGQADALVALALASAFVGLECDRESLAGVALGVAALVKVFPAALGAWLLWRRAWRATAAAIATGLFGLTVGVLLFGVDAYHRYVAVLAARSRIEEFAGTVSPNFFAMSLSRPLSQLLPALDPGLYVPASVLVLAPAVCLVALRARTLTDRLVTFLVAVLAVVLASPASNALYVVYLYFPLVCLLYLDRGRRGRGLLFAGTAGVSFPVQPAHVDAVLTAASVPTVVAAPVSSAAESLLTVASAPLLGCLAILGWCVYRAVGGQPTSRVDASPVSDD